MGNSQSTEYTIIDTKMQKKEEASEVKYLFLYGENSSESSISKALNMENADKSYMNTMLRQHISAGSLPGYERCFAAEGINWASGHATLKKAESTSDSVPGILINVESLAQDLTSKREDGKVISKDQVFEMFTKMQNRFLLRKRKLFKQVVSQSMSGSSTVSAYAYVSRTPKIFRKPSKETLNKIFSMLQKRNAMLPDFDRKPVEIKIKKCSSTAVGSMPDIVISAGVATVAASVILALTS